MKQYDVMIGKSNEKNGRAPYLLGIVFSNNEEEAIKDIAKKLKIDKSYQEEMFAILHE